MKGTQMWLSLSHSFLLHLTQQSESPTRPLRILKFCTLLLPTLNFTCHSITAQWHLQPLTEFIHTLVSGQLRDSRWHSCLFKGW